MEDELMFAVAILVGVIYVSLLVKHFSKVVVVVIVALAACAGLYLLAVTGTLVVWVGGKIATGMCVLYSFAFSFIFFFLHPPPAFLTVFSLFFCLCLSFAGTMPCAGRRRSPLDTSCSLTSAKVRRSSSACWWRWRRKNSLCFLCCTDLF